MNDTSNNSAYNTPQKKQLKNSFLFSLLMWCFSMIVIFSTLFSFTGDQSISLPKRIPVTAVSAWEKLKTGEFITLAAVNVKIKRELEKEAALHAGKQKLDKFVSEIKDWYDVYVGMKYSAGINLSYAKYKTAQTAIERWKAGEKFKSSAVSDALECISETNTAIEQHLQKQENFSDAVFLIRNGEVLSHILLQSGLGFEYIIDSMGFDEKDPVKPLVVNGYMQYDPAKIILNIEQCLEAAKLSKKRNPEIHDFCIKLVKDDHGNSSLYWGEKRGYKLDPINEMLGFVDSTPSHHGMFSEISLSGSSWLSIPCNRISCREIDKIPTIIVDLRPQAWCKWGIRQDSISQNVYPIPEVGTPYYKKSQFPSKVNYEHSSISNYIYCDLAKEMMKDKKIAEPIRPLTK